MTRFDRDLMFSAPQLLAWRLRQWARRLRLARRKVGEG